MCLSKEDECSHPESVNMPWPIGQPLPLSPPSYHPHTCHYLLYGPQRMNQINGNEADVHEQSLNRP